MVKPHATHLLICLAFALGAWFPLAAIANESDLDADLSLHSGRDAYVRHCARCHQADGRGIDGLYPSLRTEQLAKDERGAVIGAVLAGRRGGSDAHRGVWDNVMPTHGYLGNDVVAATLSYVLAQWGPGGRPFSPEEVAAVRYELLAQHPATPETAPGLSPLEQMQATQRITSAGPPLSVDEFERARSLYYGRCTGCHGVLREGTAGNPLTPELMGALGTQYLQSVISFGSSTGMPNWGTSDELVAEDMNLLARFLQHPVPQPPDMDHFQIRDGWRQYRPSAERPERPRHDYDLDGLFAVTLHDVGEIALFDGASRTLIARIPVGHAPHRLTASASGRYLYVIGRDGTVSLVDLFASPPERVASVRIGYEARAVGASRYPGFEDRFALAGAYWPPQLVLLDGTTLEPLQVVSTRGYASNTGRYHPEPRVTDVTGSHAHPEFISHIKETGHVFLFPYGNGARAAGGEAAGPRIIDLETVTELRAGSFSVDGRYYLTPADSNAVSVLDVSSQSIVAQIPARVFGGNPGVSYVDPHFGPVWAATTMVDNQLMLVGTDPDGHPDNAWRVVQQVSGPATGSLFLATHPASRHLWMDTPLTANREHSQAVSVFRKGDLAAGYQTLPIARWSGLSDGPRRVLAPAYAPDGAEVWMLVWNPQDEASAIVVVDDRSLAHTATIRLPELITPTRIYSIGALRAAGTPQPTGAPEEIGARLYAENCASCHGRYGEGDGPMAPHLATRPKDLRYLSERNQGVFPEEFVEAIIDGRAMTAAHRPEGMPVWGAEFERRAAHDPTAPSAEEKVEALVRFLEHVQIDR
ncbi:MAG: cytochrome D1 domain-containing protein [Pseudomonadales bacterium]